MKKRIGILVCMIAILSMLPVTVSATQGPQFAIGDMKQTGICGRVSVAIQNIGDEDAPNMRCWINQSGSIIDGRGDLHHYTGASVALGETVIIDNTFTGWIFGPHNFTVTAYIPGVTSTSVSKTFESFVFFGIYIKFLD